MAQSLNWIAAIGIGGAIAFAIILIGIGATIAEAWQNWEEKRERKHWRAITVIRISTLIFGAFLSLALTAYANLRSSSLQQRLSETTQTAADAMTGVKDARTAIRSLRSSVKMLARESHDATNLASAANKLASDELAKIEKLNSGTQGRVLIANKIAHQAEQVAGKSRESAQSALTSADKSRELSQASAERALESRRAALAAAIKAHVYRIPAASILAINESISRIPISSSVYIACVPGLEEVCGQLASSFRSQHIEPNVQPAAPLLVPGFDADPLAKTTNSNVVIAFMTPYQETAHGIASALESAGLRIDLVQLPVNAIKPNLQISFLYIGRAP